MSDDKSLAIARATTLAGRLVDLEADVASARELCERVIDALDAPRLGVDPAVDPGYLLPGTIVTVGGANPAVLILTADDDGLPWRVVGADGECSWRQWQALTADGPVTVIGAIPGTPAAGVKP